MSHTSVLAEEVLEWLAPGPGKVIIDGTLGCAGHAALILERLGPDGRLIGFDRDPSAIEASRKALEKYGDRAMILKSDFKNIPARLREAGIDGADGVLLDLGVSSPQLDEAVRGFSFRLDGPLDMRMDPSSPLTASEIVNRYPKKELEKILYEYGEERYARRIAEKIERERSKRRIERTVELAAILLEAVPTHYRHGRIHPATRTFQALRIAVNAELDSIGEFLDAVPAWLKPGGRAVVISFHSLEDRLVKRAFREMQKRGLGVVLTKKPVTASDAETAANPRSRSAKLRAFERGKEGGR
ncbi:MAG TPA: 16S rRNA (cytosine(1402)-N(4))-methyltransferase RsmH [Candidatus Eisenbacteria bacterium]|jgi:16S rRNA (cytosine1402-N4)-methyltransferase|nr:16S rRNA (cytosine(1402)-N(4))-methyltransferase RsmH [Candidatus Eisenbacteria bacterium]